jgi:sulfoxide reductase heme-binding subunit YedZ
MKLPTWAIVVASALLALCLGFGAMALEGGWTKDGILAGTRITARWAFPWFIVGWGASALAQAWPGGWRAGLLRRRRAIGLAFAANHFVHLGFIVAALWWFGHQVSLITLIGGGLAYVLIAAMALTSNNTAMRWLGIARWKLLHAVGGWYVLVVFANSYVSRLPTKPQIAAPAVALIVLAVGLRILAALRARGRVAGQAA